MEFATAVVTCFTKYATFSGRARRAEFWWFALFNFGVMVILAVIDAGFAISSAGVPSATIWPPCTPAPGPMSTT